MKALRGLLRKEVYHILRDRRTLVVIVLMPVVQVILFGYSIRTDVRNVRLAIVDPSPDYATLALRNRLAASPAFDIVAVLPDPGRLEPLFQSGDAQEALVIDAGFADHLARGLPARVSLVADASEPNAASAHQSYAMAVIQSYERELQSRAITLAARASPVPPALSTLNSRPSPLQIVPQVRMRFNPSRESSNLFVPGLMAMVLTIISSLMTALSLTREKEMGTMEALLVSPLRPLQIIVGKVAPYLVIGFVSVLLVLLEARLVFHVPIEGSLLLLLTEGMLFILVSLAIGIFVSSRTSSQRVAMMAALVGTMLPNQLLSGFVFPIESLPRLLQWISNVVPARWFVLIARGIMLKGVGLEYLWRETLILLAMSVVLLALSVRSFHVRLGR